MTTSGAYPTEVPSVDGKTQANDTLPSIGARGGANYLITPGPHTPPAPLRPTVSGGSGGIVGVHTTGTIKKDDMNVENRVARHLQN